jgi:hypothetical protein
MAFGDDPEKRREIRGSRNRLLKRSPQIMTAGIVNGN